LGSLTRGEFSPATRLADGAVASDPADADALSFSPVGDTFADRIDNSRDFVAGDARVGEAGKKPFLGEKIAVAKAAGLHFYSDFAGTRIGDGTIDNFDGAVGGRDLCNAHKFMMRGEAFTTQKGEIVTFLQSDSGVRLKNPCGGRQRSGMKKYIREMIADLKSPKSNKDFIPPVPKGAKEDPVKALTPPPQPPMPLDLSNQELSKNAEEQVKQLDYQAQQSERLQTNS
jgi:hypothetical protein